MGLLDFLTDEYTQAKNSFGLLGDVLKGAKRNPDNLKTVEAIKGLLGATPGVGDAIAAKDAVDYAKNGQYGMSALAGVGALPFIPNMVGMIGKETKMADVGAIKVADDAARKARMKEMGLEQGWYRGGAAPSGNLRTGPWYTRDAKEAKGYAEKYGDKADVREYAIPSGNYLEAAGEYNNKLAHDIAKILDDPYYGKTGALIAKNLRTYGPDEGLTGGQLWQTLESSFGNDGAGEIMAKLGKFSGVRGITHGPEAYVFSNAPVRDANRAAFNPSSAPYDLYGHATVPAMLSAGAFGGAGMGLLYMGQDRENTGYEERK